MLVQISLSDVVVSSDATTAFEMKKTILTKWDLETGRPTWEVNIAEQVGQFIESHHHHGNNAAAGH